MSEKSSHHWEKKQKTNLDTEQPKRLSTITTTTRQSPPNPLEDENQTIISMGLHIITLSVIKSVWVLHTDKGGTAIKKRVKFKLISHVKKILAGSFIPQHSPTIQTYQWLYNTGDWVWLIQSKLKLLSHRGQNTQKTLSSGKVLICNFFFIAIALLYSILILNTLIGPLKYF